MNVNREQSLFLVVLAIVAVFVYFRHSGAYESPVMPRQGSFEEAAAPSAPEIRFPGESNPRYQIDGRDIFLPPRDWNPLPPLALDSPPLGEIGAVGLMPSPSVEPQYGSVFRRPAVREGAAEELASNTAGGGTGGTTPGGGTGSKFAGINFSDPGNDPGPAPAIDLEKNYDWLKRQNQPNRVWGYILNPDRFQLLDDPSQAITFKQVNTDSGKSFGSASFPRGELEGAGVYETGFGFADTVRTRVILERRRVPPSVGTIRTQLQAADTCLGWVEEDAEAALEGAEFFLRSALSFNPKEADAWELLGRVKELSYDTEGELLVYDQAQDSGVKNARLDTRRGRLYRKMGLSRLAETTLRAASKSDPNDYRPVRELGLLLIAEDRAAEAVTALERAVKIGATASIEERLRLRVDLARALIRDNRMERALAQVDRALNVGVEDAEARVLKGVLNIVSGNYTAAIGELRMAREADLQMRDAIYNVGVARAVGEQDAASAEYARTIFAEAADVDPLTSFDSAVAMGALEESLGNFEQASNWFNEALLFDPGNPFGLYRAGRIARRTGDIESADVFLRESLERDGRIVDVLNELGFTAVLADEPARAEQYLRESLRREPNNEETHLLLAAALLRSNRVAQAHDEYGMGLGDPEAPSPEALCGMAWCAYREGDVDECLKRFAEARAAATGGDPFFVYADRNQAAVDDHRSKEQWVDRFDRKQVKNKWIVKEPFGPEVRLNTAGLLEISGIQRPTNPDERTELTRPIIGALFVSLEAKLVATVSAESVCGIRLATERAGHGGVQVQGEIAVALFPDGMVRIRSMDKEDALLDWDEVIGVSVERGEEVELAIERTDYDKGLFQIRVNGKVALKEHENRAFRRAKRTLVGGLFARAGARQNVGMTSDYVRIVRYQE